MNAAYVIQWTAGESHIMVVEFVTKCTIMNVWNKKDIYKIHCLSMLAMNRTLYLDGAAQNV